jgi:hypothetical protein
MTISHVETILTARRTKIARERTALLSNRLNVCKKYSVWGEKDELLSEKHTRPCQNDRVWEEELLKTSFHPKLY